MITYGQALAEGGKTLQNAGIEEYAVDSFWLLSELFNLSRTQYYMKQKDNMPAADYEKYRSAVMRRSRHEPLQYITGKAYFMGYEFSVDETVLIPRMDTEILVVEAQKILKQFYGERERIDVLDMCTGSGCIMISLALNNAKVAGVGADISESALETAKRNAKYLQCDSAAFVHSNLFGNVEGMFDMIVSNPPYIRTNAIEKLMEEVKLFEPHIALDGLEDGLHFYGRITKDAVKHLNEGGFLCYEIGCEQAEDVMAVMKENGFKNCRVVKDLAGLDRVCIGNL